MRHWTFLPIVLVAVPLAVLAAPVIETEVQRTETWANLGTAFGGFATGGGAIVTALIVLWRQRKKDAAERDARIAKEKAEREALAAKEKEERDLRWQTLVDDTAGQVKKVRQDIAGQLEEHGQIHSQISTDLKQLNGDVRQMSADVRALTTGFTSFLQTQLARSQADSATGD